MYNESQKIAFLDANNYAPRTRYKAIELFNRFEPYEVKWGIDLSKQKKDLLQEVIKTIPHTSFRGASGEISIIRSYISWCKKNGYEVIDDVIKEVEIDDLSKHIRKTMVLSPVHLKYLMDNGYEADGKFYDGFDLPEKETVDIIYRLYLWLAFSGVKERDVVDLTSLNINFQKMQIEYNGRVFVLYREYIEELSKACDLNYFVYEHNNPYYITKRKRFEGNKLLRNTRSNLDLKVVREKIRSKFGNKSYERIFMSGVFYRLNELERAGVPIVFSDIAAENYFYKNEESSKIMANDVERFRRLKAARGRDLRKNYEMWKRAFES